MQRLFSTFAHGWPGTGLFVQRVVIAATLVHQAITHLGQPAPAPQITAAGAGLLLLVGLWTPVAGVIVALSELAIGLAHQCDPWVCVFLATLGLTLSLIGPGAWSIDARLFGRKQVRM